MKLLSTTRQIISDNLKREQSVGSPITEAVFQYITTGSVVWFDDDRQTLVKEGYLLNPHVYSIINLITNAFVKIKWGTFEVKEERKANKLKRLNPLSYEAMELKAEALEEVDHDILERLAQPNPMQGYTEFMREHIGFKMLCGAGYINGVPFRDGGEFIEFWNAPSQLVDIVAGNYREPIKGYKLAISSDLRLIIDAKNMMQSKFWSPEYETGKYLYGLAPTIPAKKNIVSVNETMKSRVSLLANLGAVGILSGDKENLAMSPEDTEEVEKRYYEKFAGSDNRGKIIVTNASMKWLSMTDSYNTFEFTQTEWHDLRILCNIFGNVSSMLLNDPENKSYNNMREAEKALYTRTVIPLALDFRDEFTRWALARYKDKRKVILVPQFDDIEALQPDMEKLTKQINEKVRSGIITPNKALKMQGLEESKTANMDEERVMGNWTLVKNIESKEESGKNN